MYTLGVILKYWNEEKLLPLCLEHIKMLLPHKIYLCDDGSTDSSNEICSDFSKYTPQVIKKQLEEPKQEYFKETTVESEKINYLLKKAYDDGCDWVLCIDADELPSLPLINYIIRELPQIPPNYGIYLPICDLIDNINHFIVENHQTKFRHYPCPHLKLFGKNSGWKRTIFGMNLDQGVTGGTKYIMIPHPYFHLKYLFNNKRNIRGVSIENHPKPIYNPINNFNASTIPPTTQTKELQNWWKTWVEPDHTW